MAIENITNVVGVVSQPVLDGLDFLIKVGIGAAIAIIAYIIYLFIKGFFRARTAGHIKSILKELREINSKLDVLVKKKSRKKK